MYISKFEISNYKLFEKELILEYAPITIFTGTNNSGKSSINQLLMAILDSQANGSRIFKHLELNNDIIKLGNYKRLVTNGAKNKNVKAKLPINLRTLSPFQGCNFSIQYEFKEIDNEAVIDKIKIHLETNKKILFLSFQRVHKKDIDPEYPDDIYYDTYFNIDAITKFFIDQKLLSPKFLFFDYGFDIEELSTDEIAQLRLKEIELIKWYINDEIVASDLKHFISYFTDWSYFTDIFTISQSDSDKAEKHLNEITTMGFNSDSMKLSFAGDDFFFKHLGNLLSDIFTHNQENQYYYSSHRTISSIQERVINLPRTGNKATKSILSAAEKIMSNKENIGICFHLREFICKWLKLFEIGENISISSIDKSNLVIDIINNEKRTPLIDLGLGYRNIVMILFTIVADYYENTDDNRYYTYIDRPIVILEEPEMNLHPKLQSKLAELIIDANKTFNLQFILETHSEYIIRKLQHLVANKTTQPDKLLLYYFNKEGDINYSKINFNEVGALDKPFGKGFFDEAISLQFELYKIQSQQNN